jgi:hypothetical protein
VVGCCEHGDELSGSMKSGEFLDWQSHHQLLKKDRTPCGLVHRVLWFVLFVKACRSVLSVRGQQQSYSSSMPCFVFGRSQVRRPAILADVSCGFAQCRQMSDITLGHDRFLPYRPSQLIN